MHSKAHTLEPHGSAIDLVIHGPGACLLGGDANIRLMEEKEIATPIFLYAHMIRPGASIHLLFPGSRPVNNQVDQRV